MWREAERPAVAAPPRRRARALGFAALLLGALCLIVGAKFQLLARCGSDVPYWDQWDAEGEHLLPPYVEGRLTAQQLFQPHNEHRPVFTRLLTLALFEAGEQQWDPRPQMLVNAFLHGGFALLLIAFGVRALDRTWSWIFAILAVLFFSSTVTWENTLAGFQSQFYFVLLFSALHVGGTLLARPGSRAALVAPLAGVAALFSMASGPLSAMAVIAAVAVRALRDRGLSRHDVWTLASNAALVALGLGLKADVPGHAVLKAGSFAVWVDAWLHELAWPIVHPAGALLGIVAPLAALWAYWKRKLDGPVALTVLAMAIWAGLQAAALAYARGGDNRGYSWRYFDTLGACALIYFLTLACVVHALPGFWRRLGQVVGVATAIMLAVTLARETRAAERDVLTQMPGYNAARRDSVRDYVATGDTAKLDRKPWEELPYPSPQRLAELLDRPVVRRILPPSLRPPTPFAPDTQRTIGFEENPALPDPAPNGLRSWRSNGAAAAHFESAPFPTQYSRVTVFAAGAVGPAQLALIATDGRTVTPLSAVELTPRWRRLNFSVSPGEYRLAATPRDSAWMAVTQPVTTSPLSAWAAKAPHAWPWFVTAGAMLLAGSLLVSVLITPARPAHRAGAAAP